MCGRTTLIVTPEDLETTFGYVAPANYRPHYNIVPTHGVLAIASEGVGEGFRGFRWGLVRGWADGFPATPLINVRSESLFERPSFRESAERRRCLVVVDGYYEWKAATGGNRPHRFRRRDQRAFTLAGIWDRWFGPDGVVESCAIVTTAANGLNSGIHGRMPVIVDEEDRALWMSSASPLSRVESLLETKEAPEMEVYEVGRAVNDVNNDGPECIEPSAGPDQFSLDDLWT